VEDAARSFGDLDLFVMSSSGEGLGSAALEALAAGVAPVLARAGGLADVAGGELPSVPPSDPEALAGAVLGLLAAPGRRARVAAAARERAGRFTADRMTEGTLDAYRAALRRRR
ncbi:MAG TPA: glycosyltransferase family 4 protein, partial [Gemmatimonadota bacterium]|nr:glycosyltransferase family 4 protein [Gemmatimonadota bacterium]